MRWAKRSPKRSIRSNENQKKKEVDAVVSSEDFQELREQAQALRQAARLRQQKSI